ncbi:ATP-binding SpoIIE family protein phosphatase [Magnetococcales bacterium HHB-1]
MKILVVDDDRINNTILQKLLGRDGHEVFVAYNGRDGVELFNRARPHLVLMDIRMPHMNGYEAARRIKEATPDQFIPIIFLTAVTDEEGLAQCIEAGGDDFLTKPFNRTILHAKIGAMERIRSLHVTLRRQKRQLEVHQETTRQELEVGKHLFTNIVQAGSLLDAPCLNYWSSPMSLFNGDLLAANYNPAGGISIMLGDFTGHGLSAAVGALPLAELFYDRTAQGFSIGELVEEINAKLLAILPSRMFCAACFIEVDPRQKHLTIWNGGLPDVLIADQSGKIIHRVQSMHLPLGVVSFARENRKVELIEMHEGYRVFLYSDGLTEAVNKKNEMYQQQRLEDHFSGAVAADKLFQTILDDLSAFREGEPQADDISLLEVDCVQACQISPSDVPLPDQKKLTPSKWDLSFSFSAETLRSVDPLPIVINALMNLQAPAGHRERIYTVLAELFSNALDHGLLNLDTQIKKTPEGFVRYYSQREERLTNLREGSIQFYINHTPRFVTPPSSGGTTSPSGGEILIRVEDSGGGFDPKMVHSSLKNNLGHGGRGIALIRTLCSSLIYHGKGNIAEAIYHWNFN